MISRVFHTISTQKTYRRYNLALYACLRSSLWWTKWHCFVTAIFEILHAFWIHLFDDTYSYNRDIWLKSSFSTYSTLKRIVFVSASTFASAFASAATYSSASADWLLLLHLHLYLLWPLLLHLYLFLHCSCFCF